ncbi:MAG: hydroxyectoine utilization dehydratase EutB [Alphaproteobacteria bacterium HGW-Alphaproteobacteria-6]|nr:MAG: hydroxyectoine utilization dehydratase EutB [Alphaproteobacteria bacterium HGW-Alphaproteobacteria-6]
MVVHIDEKSVTLAAITAAARDLAGQGGVLRSPMLRSEPLSRRFGADILMKMEVLQPMGAFKLRGASHAIARLTDTEAGRGVVCCSTGNHGRAVAHAARARGIAATVCLSALVPPAKVDAVAALGARVLRHGDSQDDAQREASRLVATEGLTEIPPFDHPDVIAGQGTIGLELLADRPDLGAILVPLSGGGLLAGIAVAVKALKPSVRVIGLSMDRGAAMAASLGAGRPVAVPEVATLADSLGGGIGLANRWTFALCRDLVDDVILLSEAEIYDGMRWMLMQERIVVEGAAAVGAAALLAGKVRPEGPTAIIVSGQNVAMKQVLAVARGLPVTLGGMTVEGTGCAI